MKFIGALYVVKVVAVWCNLVN